MTYKSLKELFIAICDAIRNKEGSTGEIEHQDIPARINAFSSIISKLQGKKIIPSETENVIKPDDGYDGLSSVTVEAIPATYIGSGVTKKETATYIPGTSDQTINENQFLIGTQTIKGDTDLVSENIKSGVTIFNVEGTYVGNETTTIPEGYVDTSSGDATASHILSGKKAWVDGEEVTGNIPTKTSADLTVDGSTVTVPAGYYGSLVSKSVNSVAQASPVITIDSNGLITASATQDAGYVNSGTKSDTEQLTTQSAKTVTPGTSSKTAVSKGVYTTGAITVAGDYDLVSSNIKKGITIFDVTGSYEGEPIPDGYVDTSDGDATSSDMANGKKAYVDGKLVTGNVHTIESGFVTSSSYGTTEEPVTESTSLSIYHTFDNNYIFRNGAGIIVDASLELFGDAQPSDVLSGKKFTSSSGLMLEGTAVMSSGKYNSGDVVRSAKSQSREFSWVDNYTTLLIRYCSVSDLSASNGSVTMNNYTSLQVDADSDCSVLKGKYIQVETTSSGGFSDVYFVGTSATFSIGTLVTGKYLRISPIYSMFVIA